MKIDLEGTVEAKEFERIIDSVKSDDPGGTVIFFAGIHGNEPSGVIALQRELAHIRRNGLLAKGSVYALAGNLNALKKGKRFEKDDLNRIWSADRINAIMEGSFEPDNQDEREQMILCGSILDILNREQGPFYFFDLHSTSSPTVPFIVVNDSLLNRRYTSQYPLPVILGIEEYLDGPLLSYINELGYVAFGFEGGQHDDPVAIQNHRSFAAISLYYIGMTNESPSRVAELEGNLMEQTIGLQNFFEIFYGYRIEQGDRFTMEPGYSNFQPVLKGQKLAINNGKIIMADQDARIFMPLYQSQGSEGFFAVKEVPAIFLRLSAWFRSLRIDHWLTVLPGVNWLNKERSTMLVNKRVARFMARQFFHLMGYRSRKVDDQHLVVNNRESASRTSEYMREKWYRKVTSVH